MSRNLILPNQRKPGPHIISPYTGRPLVEDFLGKTTFDKLNKMLAKDSRLSPDMRSEVLLRVYARRHEIDDRSRTLGDIAAEEANRIVKETAN